MGGNKTLTVDYVNNMREREIKTTVFLPHRGRNMALTMLCVHFTNGVDYIVKDANRFDVALLENDRLQISAVESCQGCLQSHNRPCPISSCQECVSAQEFCARCQEKGYKM